MQKRPLSMGCLVVVTFLAILVCLFHKEPVDYEPYEGQQICLKGTVYQKEIKQNGLAVFIKGVSAQDTENQFPKVSRVVCYLKQGEKEPELGSCVVLTGKVKCFRTASNPGEFDARSYYQILRISFGLSQTTIQQKSTTYHKLEEGLYRFRCRLSGKLSEHLPPEEASLMKTILLGEKGELDEDLKMRYQRNGIAHILAISGLHISMLGMGFFKCARRLGVPRKASATGACMVVLLFGMMTGFSVSAIRAVLMFLLQMIAILVGRTYDMITAIAVASVLILLEQPLYLYHTGFLFSFGCVLGISLVSPVLTNISDKKFAENLPIKSLFNKSLSIKSSLVKGVLSGASMMAVTLPVYLYFFYQVPVYSMLLNFIVLPLMNILMAAGIFLLILSFVFPPLCNVLSWLIMGILEIYENAAKCAEQFPMHYWTPGKPELWQVLFYVAILILIAALGRNQRRSRRKAKKQTGKFVGIPVIGCWGLLALAIVEISIRVPPSFQVTFLDVGQGDCIFVRNGKHASYLIDGGSSSFSQVGKYRILPFLKYQGASELQAVFVTHPDEDHCNGIMELLEQGKLEGIQIRNLVLPDISEAAKSEGYYDLVNLAGQYEIPVTYLHRGQKISSAQGFHLQQSASDRQLQIQCLHPAEDYFTENSNEYSMVLQLQYGGLSLLLTGDVEGQGETELQEYLNAGQDAAMLSESLDEGKRNDRTDNFSGSTNQYYKILKVAHHGSKNSTSDKFLEILSPQLAIISCGKDNRYGHPHEETLQRLEDSDTEWLCTKDYGAITVTIDKKGEICVQGYGKGE